VCLWDVKRRVEVPKEGTHAKTAGESVAAQTRRDQLAGLVSVLDYCPDVRPVRAVTSFYKKRLALRRGQPRDAADSN
jgi:hypothetical protein